MCLIVNRYSQIHPTQTLISMLYGQYSGHEFSIVVCFIIKSQLIAETSKKKKLSVKKKKKKEIQV